MAEAFEDPDAIDEKLPTEAIIEHDNDEKYIVGLISPMSIDSKDTVKERYVLVSMKKKYHADIAETYEMRLGEDADLYVMGGGILTIDRVKKTIKTYGTSGGYGKPNKALVEKILKNAFPDWKLDITITNYIRG
eukprot:TRINITY_DN8999_c0_g1_i1.p1 TRINITY_DN8999_c0_g1~~TRINITY_DN8999_c0_g1_i1.p1  ORF type:complete len:144 (-),score=31.09 TRINITY_DN8999_c0_g1_i1:10-411(-)